MSLKDEIAVSAKERDGYCMCGCGKKTRISGVTRRDRGDIKGYPVRYVYGHNAKDPRWRARVGEWTHKANWQGGRIAHQGYVLRHRKTFTAEDVKILGPMFTAYHKNGRYILEHRALVALREGRVLDSDEYVRHLDGNRKNNSSDNLLLGTAKDNTGDHESLRRDNIRLRGIVSALREEVKRHKEGAR